jgi:pheromone shutdown protein TraB
MTFGHGFGVIVLVGVGHVFDIASQVSKIIEEERPDAVCVELDQARYDALLNPGKRTNAHPFYRLLAKIQRRLADQFGGEVGAEMLAATRTAQAIGAEVLLIDTDAAKMFSRLNTELPLREKAKLGFSVITSLFISRRTLEREIDNLQEDTSHYMDEMGQQLPTLKKVLVDDRNILMAKRIDNAASRYPVVLAVIGDGHVEGIDQLLDRDDVKVYRLKDVRMGGRPSARQVPTNAQARFHF